MITAQVHTQPEGVTRSGKTEDGRCTLLLSYKVGFTEK